VEFKYTLLEMKQKILGLLKAEVEEMENTGEVFEEGKTQEMKEILFRHTSEETIKGINSLKGACVVYGKLKNGLKAQKEGRK